MGDEHLIGIQAEDDRLGFADTDTTAIGDAIPTEVLSSSVLLALYASRQFEGLISAVREDLTAQAGDTVKVVKQTARTAQGPIAEGTALTDTASAFTATSLVLQKFGDYDRVTNEVFEDQELFPVDSFAENMGNALREQIEQLIYDALEAATPGQSEALATAGDLSDFYDQVVELAAAMKGAKYAPSHLVIHPDMEAAILQDTSEGTKKMQIKTADGVVTEVIGLKTIVSPLANAQVATLNEVQGIVIDASRALAECWGRMPNFIVDRTTDAVSDRTRIITWLRYDTEVLDTGAVGHVVNPAA